MKEGGREGESLNKGLVFFSFIVLVFPYLQKMEQFDNYHGSDKKEEMISRMWTNSFTLPRHVQHEKDQMHHLYILCVHPTEVPAVTGINNSLISGKVHLTSNPLTTKTVKYFSIGELNNSTRCWQEMRHTSSTTRSTIFKLLTVTMAELPLQGRMVAVLTNGPLSHT